MIDLEGEGTSQRRAPFSRTPENPSKPMLRRCKQVLLTLAAIVFLFEAWLWDWTIAAGRWAIALVPWQEFKATVLRMIERLPPYGALPLFIIPIVIIEPLKVVAIEQLAHGHLLRGLAAFIVLKFAGVGLVALVFDLTRDKLLAIGWFSRFYLWILKWRKRAHDFIEPYKAAVRAELARIRAYAANLESRRNLSAGRGRLLQTLIRLRARVRRAQD